MIRNLFGGRGGRDGSLASFLGPLEIRVLESLWRREGEVSVREMQDDFPGAAYTTLMTTLDRLFKKGLLERHKDGTAFVYRPAMSHDDYRRRIVESAVGGLMRRSTDSNSVLAAFVDAAADVDDANLRRLEELIAERRRSGR
jgi:predicted transcriptional regulator